MVEKAAIWAIVVIGLLIFSWLVGQEIAKTFGAFAWIGVFGAVISVITILAYRMKS